ncbi:hypothetical protein F5B18DRAFT_637049 [Nemania serpens]|nr:hypothetical protein F5B18DRAFT_637049 [Nemania serpens]
MGNPRPPTPCLLGRRPSNGSQEAALDARQSSPQTLIPPDHPKSEIPSRRVLSVCMQPRVILPSLTPEKIVRKPVPESVTERPNTQPKSMMALRLARLKDKWQGFKARASPTVFRFAGHVFLGIVLIVFASVIIGWFGMSKDTVTHEGTTAVPTMTAEAIPCYYESLCPTETSPSHDQPDILAHGAPTDATPTTTTPPDATPKTTTPPDEPDKVTIVRTVILTVTKVITDTALKTLTTTVLVPTCITDITKPTIGISSDTTDTSTSTSTTNRVMTGRMYCSFTGRRNIYTLCPLVHTDSLGMLPSAPAVASAATHGMKNPLGAVRLKITSLWNSIPGVGRVMRGEDREDREDRDCDCDCFEMKRKLDIALSLVRGQNRLIDHQRGVINQHKENLVIALQALENVTAAAARARGGATGGRVLDLYI